MSIEIRVALWRLKWQIKGIHRDKVLTQIGFYKKEKLKDRLKRRKDTIEEIKKIIFEEGL